MILLLSQFKLGHFVMAMLLTMASIFMILLILVQQGRGGGLTGALGGMGGQSAFGTKAGDLFTRITIVTAIIWILLSILTIAFFNRPVVITSAPAPTSLSPEADESGAGEPIDEGQPMTDPPKAENDEALEDNTKLNPPADAVPQESKQPDAGKDADKNGSAAPGTDPSATQPTTPSPDADKSGKTADDKPPGLSDGG